MDSTIELMIKRAASVLPNAYSPFSHFSVAACISTPDNKLYAGVNVENSAYGQTLCAEMSAIAHMIAAGDRTIEHILILSSSKKSCPPCGGCRQGIYEFSTKKTRVHLSDGQKIIQSYGINELLPCAFHL